MCNSPKQTETGPGFQSTLCNRRWVLKCLFVVITVFLFGLEPLPALGRRKYSKCSKCSSLSMRTPNASGNRGNRRIFYAVDVSHDSEGRDSPEKGQLKPVHSKDSTREEALRADSKITSGFGRRSIPTCWVNCGAPKGASSLSRLTGWACRPRVPRRPRSCDLILESALSLKTQPREEHNHEVNPRRVKQRRVVPSWKRNFHYGVDFGTYLSFGLGLEFLVKIMPVLEIRWVRPEGSKIKSADRVLRIGLRFDTGLHGTYYDDDDSSAKTLLMLGPEVGFRMYWPGEKDSSKVRLLHGPFLGLQYFLYRDYWRTHDELEKKLWHFFNVRAGYELGMVLFRRYQIMIFLGTEKIMHLFFGFNFGYGF